MKRWLFYNALAWHDITRLWRATRHQVIIVTGICLPVLLLLGLKRGHVAELRHDLITSPTGRQIVYWSAQRGKLLSDEVLRQMTRQLSNVEVIVPETQRIVRLDRTQSFQTDNVAGPDHNTKGPTANELLITLYSTDEGDPILRQFAVDVLRKGEHAVVLTSNVARRIGVHAGDHVPLTIFRRRDGVDESHSFSVLVKAEVPSTDNTSLSGYANVTLLAQLEQYVRGYAVPELGLPAMRGITPPDEYESYLLFCQKGPQTDLTSDDLAFLSDRGLQCNHVDDPALKSLYGLLQAGRLDGLNVYKLTQGKPDDESQQTIKTSPLYITENTQAVDDFALRWNPPTLLQVDGKPVRLVGLSLPTVSQSGGWIREYLSHPDLGFDFELSMHQPLQIRFLDDTQSGTNTDAYVQLKSGETIPLSLYHSPHAAHEASPQTTDNKPFDTDRQGAANTDTNSLAQSTDDPSETINKKVSPEGSPQKGAQSIADDGREQKDSEKPRSDDNHATPAIAIVPANCLAWLRQAMNGKLTYDPQSHAFTAIPEPILFDKARLYTNTIDDVPAVVDKLSAAGYAVLSEGNHIAEIQSQDRSLQALVVVVGLGVFLFGTVTVIGVLVDATERKRGTIGILRVMGMSRAGIFFVVVQRSLIVGVLAAGLSICLGTVLAWIMASISGRAISLENLSLPTLVVPKVSIVFHRVDYLTVCIGALICSGLGAVFPAWRASAIDPFDAIVEGKFH
jgi:FtsX-like permease family